MRFYTAFARAVRPWFRFFFYPNPGNAQYGSPMQTTLIILCVALIAFSFGLWYWRKHLQNPVTRKLSRSWGSASFWFGIAGLVLVVARVEEIQFLAMRLLWVLWWAGVAVYLFFQVRTFRARHCKVLPKERVFDPRDRYLPGKRK